MIFTKKQHQDLRTYALVLFSFSLPLFPRLATWVVATWFLCWLIGLQPIRYFKKLQTWWPWAPITYFLFFLLAITWSSFPESSAQILETQLSLLVFPLLLGVGPDRSGSDLVRLVRPAFLAGCSLAMLICLGQGIAHFSEEGFAGLSYTQLGAPLSFHPTYFALYLNFGIFWVIDGMLKKEMPMWVATLFIAVALLFIVLLAARMQWILLLMVGGGSFLLYQWRKGTLSKGILWSLLAFVVIGGLSWSIPTTRHRIDRAITEFSGAPGSENIRLRLWQSAKAAWAEAPLLGHGTGSGQAVLMQKYEAIDCQDCLEDRLNAHNQYLQTAVTGGAIGLLLLLTILLSPVIWIRKKTGSILWIFLWLFGLSLLTESMFATQRGSMFFGFFYTFLIWNAVTSLGRTIDPELASLQSKEE